MTSLKSLIISSKTLQNTLFGVQHPQNGVWGPTTDHSSPKNTALGKKRYFLAIFRRKMRFFGDGGSEKRDNLLQNLAKHVFPSLDAKDDWVQGLVPSPGTLVGRVGPPRAVIPPAFALVTPLRLFFTSGLAPGIPLGIRPGERTIPDVDGAVLTAAPSSDRPGWGFWLQGLR